MRISPGVGICFFLVCSSLLSGCSLTPKVQYQLFPMKGAKQTMTQQQALIVCREQGRVAEQQAKTGDIELRKLGGFLPTLVADINAMNAEEAAFVACLARAGYERRAVSSSPSPVQSDPGFRQQSLHSSHIQNGLLACSYGSGENLRTRWYDAQKISVCPPNWFN